MKRKEILNEINKLELIEKIVLVEDVWDSIAKSNSEIPMPEWQKIELDKRYAKYKKGEMTLHDWEDVHKNIKEKHK